MKKSEEGLKLGPARLRAPRAYAGHAQHSCADGDSTGALNLGQGALVAEISSTLGIGATGSVVFTGFSKGDKGTGSERRRRSSLRFSPGRGTHSGTRGWSS